VAALSSHPEGRFRSGFPDLKGIGWALAALAAAGSRNCTGARTPGVVHPGCAGRPWVRILGAR
jgi:hypothetical protein